MHGPIIYDITFVNDKNSWKFAVDDKQNSRYQQIIWIKHTQATNRNENFIPKTTATINGESTTSSKKKF